jgi:4-oxalomesaconate tautomerase
MRGGNSKGLYFDARLLPAERGLRDRVLLAAMGSPDVRQVDGMGGGHHLTSKVALIGPPTRTDADVDYLFLQLAIDKAEVSAAIPGENLLAAVGPWAIENGLVPVAGETTPVRIHVVNTNRIAVATVCTPHGAAEYEGDARIDGVPGRAAPILIEFLDIAGATCGALLPTGLALDEVDGVEVTCIDNGLPMAIARAAEFDKRGHETPDVLERDATLKARLESLRLKVGRRMNLGDVARKTVPAMCLVSPPEGAGALCTRTFIPHRVHESIGVLGAVTVATACVIPGSVAAKVARVGSRTVPARLDIEHPTGSFTIDVDVHAGATGIHVRRAALLRTARKLMRGEVYVPSGVWEGPGAGD